MGKCAGTRRKRTQYGNDQSRHAIVGAVVIVGGSLANHNALEQQEQIREVIMHRFQNNEVTYAQFRDVLGDRIDPANLKKYWEL